MKYTARRNARRVTAILTSAALLISWGANADATAPDAQHVAAVESEIVGHDLATAQNIQSSLEMLQRAEDSGDSNARDLVRDAALKFGSIDDQALTRVKDTLPQQSIDALGLQSATFGENLLTINEESEAAGGLSTTHVKHIASDLSNQIVVIIDDRSRQETEFTLNLPNTQQAQVDEDGSITIRESSTNEAVGYIEAPWARDANGKHLNTWYELENDNLVQHVDTEGAAFPVVADPSWWWWASTGVVCLGEIASFFGPALAAKLAKGAAKIKSLMRKSKTLTDLVKRAGGAKNAVKYAVSYIVYKVKNVNKFTKEALSKIPVPRWVRNNPDRARQLLILVGDWILDAIGIGTCGALVKELVG